MGTNNLPCPWCGNFHLTLQTSTRDREGTPCCMMCDECGASGPWLYVQSTDWAIQEAEALTAWDRRRKREGGE